MSYLERAHDILRQNFISAMCEDRARVIETPGWNIKSWPVTSEFEELLGDVGMGGAWRQMATVLGRCAAGQMDQQTHLEAKALLAALADKHAKWHGDDLAERLRDDDDEK